MKKDKNPLLQKYRSRLTGEGVIKALIGGVSVGSVIGFAVAFGSWFFDFGGIWPSACVTLSLGAVSAILLYLLKYRPSEQEIARRMDGLGLEERVVTMLEFADDDSCIAKLQRENAKQSIAEAVNAKMRFKISGGRVAWAVVAFLLTLGMTTVSGLASTDLLPSGAELVNPKDPYEDHLTVTYLAEVGGELAGTAEQLILPGEPAEPVVAVADEGYIFVGWSDGHKDPQRHDENVLEEFSVTALFKELGSDGAEEEDEGNEAQDLPMDSAFNQSGSSSGESADGEEGDSDTGEDEDGSGSDDSTGLGSAGKWEDGNQFIDGETYYRDYLDIYYEMAMEIFAETGEIPPEMREFFEKYFGGI